MGSPICRPVNRQDAKDAKLLEPDSDLDHAASVVIDAALEVHRLLGPGLLESVRTGLERRVWPARDSLRSAAAYRRNLQQRRDRRGSARLSSRRPLSRRAKGLCRAAATPPSASSVIPECQRSLAGPAHQLQRPPPPPGHKARRPNPLILGAPWRLGG